jgi:hypothetical protein
MAGPLECLPCTVLVQGLLGLHHCGTGLVGGFSQILEFPTEPYILEDAKDSRKEGPNSLFFIIFALFCNKTSVL